MDVAAGAVAPAAVAHLARHRTLPVVDPLASLLPSGALVRGQTVSCRGVAAPSLALALAVEATATGSWLAVVDVPWLGVEAAAELGIPLERLVRVDGRAAGDWADLTAAVLDGFEVVITRIPRRLDTGARRRVQARVKAREAVLLAVGDPPGVDVVMEASAPVWEGVEQGWGHLRGRRVTVESSGRRVPRPRRVDLWLPAPGGGVAIVEEPPHCVPRPRRMLPAQLVAARSLALARSH
jgi:hypothetical protein